MMLAKTRRDYALRVIGEPLVPEKAVRPHRLLMIVVASGGIFLVILSFIVLGAAVKQSKDQ
jgi:hypothetical protein